jgi:hypothetical protein
MTRFMMSLDDAVDLVLYAFEHGGPGDLFVQKAPATTIGTLAEAVKRVFRADNPVRIIGTRHGEKLYETLLTREEMVRAVDLGDYFQVAADIRGLNYDKYFSQKANAAWQKSRTTTRTTPERLDLAKRSKRCCGVCPTSSELAKNEALNDMPKRVRQHRADVGARHEGEISMQNGADHGSPRVHRPESRSRTCGHARRDSAEFDVDDSPELHERRPADVVFHLAGVNRPQEPEEFESRATPGSPANCAGCSARGKTPRT